MKNIDKVFVILSVVALSLIIRSGISMHGYSGYNNPPMFGDFEAQRHWQEITVNLPIKDWYENTTSNDLLYWGLDYPPLTAYHSWIVGKLAAFENISYVDLGVSRGFTDENHKYFMRKTVLFADVLIYIPALLYCAIKINTLKFGQIKSNDNLLHLILHIIIMILYTGQILIDNGHFQYNNISLGLTALAIAFILNNKNKIGSFIFVLALNFKQMELYHALPVFFYILGDSFSNKSQESNTFFSKVFRVIKIGMLVIITFLLIWIPWLRDFNGLKQVLHRIFPIARGVFEDKVSNIWCIINIFVKLKERYSVEQMAKICGFTTISTVIFSCIKLLFKSTKEQFLLSLINCSLSFFLFSFQVHEKSILLVALPMIIFFPFEPFVSFWFLHISAFSMIPLLNKDKLVLPTICISTIYFLLVKQLGKATYFNDKKSNLLFDIFLVNLKFPKSLKESIMILFNLSTLGTILLVLVFLFVPSPSHLPHLYSVFISTYSCIHFIGFLLYFNYLQLIM